jgi:hypothetical protein
VTDILDHSQIAVTMNTYDRLANNALWRVALVRMDCHQPTKDYVTRRISEGKTKPKILRCLKRSIARETYPLLQATVIASGPR